MILIDYSMLDRGNGQYEMVKEVLVLTKMLSF
jgi:hypothetical protein